MMFGSGPARGPVDRRGADVIFDLVSVQVRP